MLSLVVHGCWQPLSFSNKESCLYRYRRRFQEPEYLPEAVYVLLSVESTAVVQDGKLQSLEDSIHQHKEKSKHMATELLRLQVGLESQACSLTIVAYTADKMLLYRKLIIVKHKQPY